MKTSQTGIDFIKRWEGLKLKAYQDVADIWTIGYGHTLSAKPGMVITQEEAEDLLRRDLAVFEDAVHRLITVQLAQHEFDALVSFTYNVGVGALGRSTVRTRLNKGNRAGAGDAMLWWNKARPGGVLQEVAGLTNRRLAERSMFVNARDRCPASEGLVDAPGLLAALER